MYSGGHKKDFSNDNEMEGERDSSRFSDEDENGCSKKKKLQLSKEKFASPLLNYATLTKIRLASPPFLIDTQYHNLIFYTN